MTDVPAQPNGDSDEVEGVQPGSEIETLTSAAITLFADLERERLVLQREQQAITLRGWEVMESADRRQNETAVKRIEAENEQDKRKHHRAVVAVSLGIGVPLALLTLTLVVALFGSERQSQIALDVLKIAGIALGGGGFIFGVAYAINRLIRN